MHKGNKGEWSEIYAFFKLLSDGVLYASDENLNKIENKYLNIKRIIREEKSNATQVREKRIYELLVDQNQVVIKDSSENELKLIDLTPLKTGVKNIFNSIKNGTGASFGIIEADNLMVQYLCEEIKASSSDKSDIRLVIHDRFSPAEIESGFSIKSAFKAAPTLLNSSKKNTSFLYEVIGDKSVDEINETKGKYLVRERATSIYNQGSALEFLGVESPVFKNNLKRINNILPNVLASMLSLYFRGKGTTVIELLTCLQDDLSLKQYELNYGDYEYMIKQFLEAVALGMTPAKEWSGRAEAQGGYIIVKDDGELVCFHLYNREKFLDYLLANTKFDSPSTTRHKYGEASEENGKKYFRLNLQVRFI